MAGKSYVTRGHDSLSLADAGVYQTPSWLPLNALDSDSRSIDCGDVLLQIRIAESATDSSSRGLDAAAFANRTSESVFEIAPTQSIEELVVREEGENEAAEASRKANDHSTRFDSVDVTDVLPEVDQIPLQTQDSTPQGCVDITRFDVAALNRECYSWLWYIGFRGIDPLATVTSDTLSSRPVSVSMQSSSNSTLEGILIAFHPMLFCLVLNQRAPHLEERVDVQYPLAWLKDHCSALARDADLLGRHVEVYRSWVREGRTFRGSQLKKQMELQQAPINMHYQYLVMQSVPHTDTAPSSSEGERNTVVVDFVSVGACTTHALGFKHGGLSALEMRLVSD